jgi:hypothetical protein
MKHGYAGARTMGQEFLENLWGWQVTRPDLIQQWAWDEVKETWFEDKHKLGLPRLSCPGPQRPRQGADAGHLHGRRREGLLAGR